MNFYVPSSSLMTYLEIAYSYQEAILLNDFKQSKMEILSQSEQGLMKVFYKSQYLGHDFLTFLWMSLYKAHLVLKSTLMLMIRNSSLLVKMLSQFSTECRLISNLPLSDSSPVARVLMSTNVSWCGLDATTKNLPLQLGTVTSSCVPPWSCRV